MMKLIYRKICLEGLPLLQPIIHVWSVMKGDLSKEFNSTYCYILNKPSKRRRFIIGCLSKICYFTQLMRSCDILKWSPKRGGFLIGEISEDSVHYTTILPEKLLTQIYTAQLMLYNSGLTKYSD